MEPIVRIASRTAIGNRRQGIEGTPTLLQNILIRIPLPNTFACPEDTIHRTSAIKCPSGVTSITPTSRAIRTKFPFALRDVSVLHDERLNPLGILAGH